MTGTLRALSTPLVVMSTWTGAWSSPPALAGSSRLMKVGMVASAACRPCPAGVWATRPNPATRPVTGVLPGSVIWARSPFLTSPCWDGSRFTCTCSVSDVALSTGAPGRADPPTWPVTLAIRTASGRKTASSMASAPVTPSALAGAGAP